MYRRIRSLFTLGLLTLALFAPLYRASGQAQTPAPLTIVMTAKGALTPTMVGYIGRGIKIAEDQHAQVVVIQLDTPGGGIDLMEEIVQEIRASTVPVVVYVSPANAMAASAGTLITLSGHLAAMAPQTTIGAASPVGPQGQDIGQTEDAKVKAVLKATARTLAQDRSPQAIQAAQDTIDNAKALTVDEAMQIGLVDIKANNLQDLLSQLNGRTVKLASGTATIRTTNATIEEIPYSFIEQILQLLTDPNLVFILLAVGVQAILIELSNPGGWVPGFIGAICLLLAVYGIGLLPVNWVGGLFIVLAFVLFILDIKAATHGALTVAGAVSFIAGALILFNSVHIPGAPTVSVPLVIGTGIFIAASFFAIVSIALRAQRAPVHMGSQILLGKVGTVRSELNPRGQIQVAGEIWAAELNDGETSLPAGSRVEVVAVNGLRLKVRPVKNPS
jgi:membrane-bound serine protease (ClpP class)